MELVNRVASSGLITFNLEHYYPEQQIDSFDLKEFLWKEFILKEKEFRMALKAYDWSQHEGHVLCVYCSNDAIIPVWAHMLVSSLATQGGATVFGGTQELYLQHYYRNLIHTLPVEPYEGQRVVIKGCSDRPVPASAYLDIQSRLTGVAQSIMYGEPCSTVPIYKQPRKLKR